MAKNKKLLAAIAAATIFSTICISNVNAEYANAENKDKSIRVKSQYKNLRIYLVKDGDNIWEIASDHKEPYEKTSNVVARIQLANNVDECIYPGQRLLIPIK